MYCYLADDLTFKEKTFPPFLETILKKALMNLLSTILDTSMNKGNKYYTIIVTIGVEIYQYVIGKKRSILSRPNLVLSTNKQPVLKWLQMNMTYV